MSMIQLQLAMDGAYDGRTVEEAVSILSNGVQEQVDIIEVGTSMIYRWGMAGVQAMKQHFPHKLILADMKIMDGGGKAAAMACRLGADIVTALGVSHPETIRNVTQAAHANGGKVMVDFMCVKDIEKQIAFCESIGVDYICAHYAVDMQEKGANDAHLELIAQSLHRCQLAIAGGINAENVIPLLTCAPAIVISGKAIYAAADPSKEAKKIKDQLREWEHTHG